MPTKETIIAMLREIFPRLAAAYGVSKIGLKSIHGNLFLRAY